MSAPLSVVLLAGRQRPRAERVLEALARQTLADPLEVIVLDSTPDAGPLRAPDGLAVRTVTAPPDAGYGEIRALGVSEASAPVIAFLEDHCYPDPGWAAAVVKAFRGPWAGVGYAFRVANPEAWACRIAAVTEYGQWLEPVRSGERTQLPGNNVAYRRAALERFGARLPDLLDVDFVLHRALRAAGEHLFVAGDAVVAHEHFARLRDAAYAAHLYCSLLAQRRSVGWSRRRRLAYGLLVPVVAPVRRVQMLLSVMSERPGLGRMMLAAAPGMLVLYVVSALGEARGYLRPRPGLDREFARAELDMPRAVTAR